MLVMMIVTVVMMSCRLYKKSSCSTLTFSLVSSCQFVFLIRSVNIFSQNSPSKTSVHIVIRKMKSVGGTDCKEMTEFLCQKVSPS
jgi:hypothetical protein